MLILLIYSKNINPEISDALFCTNNVWVYTTVVCSCGSSFSNRSSFSKGRSSSCGSSFSSGSSFSNGSSFSSGSSFSIGSSVFGLRTKHAKVAQ